MIEFYVCLIALGLDHNIILMFFYGMYCAIGKIGKVQNTLRKN